MAPEKVWITSISAVMTLPDAALFAD